MDARADGACSSKGIRRSGGRRWQMVPPDPKFIQSLDPVQDSSGRAKEEEARSRRRLWERDPFLGESFEASSSEPDN